MEKVRAAAGMQVLTSDGEYIGDVDSPGEDGFTLRRLSGSDHERVPTLWVHRVDQHVHLNRTGAEAIAGWKSLKFTTSGTASACSSTGEKSTVKTGFNTKWLLWIGLAVIAILILMMVF